jgi:hypothetical protein
MPPKARARRTRIRRGGDAGGAQKTRRTRDTAPLHCSPAAEADRATPGTCFSSAVLTRIRNAYNAKHPRDKIAAGAPSEVLAALRARLRDCGAKEDCWLKLLPARERSYLDKHVFAPDHPASWRKNPTEWLSNFDIEKVLVQYEDAHDTFLFIGPTAIDFDAVLDRKRRRCVWQELCDFSVARCVRTGKRKIGIVFNLDKHDQGGSHWVSMFIDLDEKFIFYFDSAANETPPEITRLVERVQKQGAAARPALALRYIENYPHRHQSSNTECGMYALFFIKTMLERRTEYETNLSADAAVALFTRKKIPDKYVRGFRTRYFNGGDDGDDDADF